MGFKGTGKFKEPEEIQEEFCDICKQNMDDVYPNYNLTIEHHEHRWADDDSQTMIWSICSSRCLFIAAKKFGRRS